MIEPKTYNILVYLKLCTEYNLKFNALFVFAISNEIKNIILR